MFYRPKASGTLDANGVEGQGVYFDNGSHKCRSQFGRSWGNVGEGFFINDTIECGHYGGVTEDWNTFVACTLDAQNIATRGGHSVVK